VGAEDGQQPVGALVEGRQRVDGGGVVVGRSQVGAGRADAVAARGAGLGGRGKALTQRRPRGEPALVVLGPDRGDGGQHLADVGSAAGGLAQQQPHAEIPVALVEARRVDLVRGPASVVELGGGLDVVHSVDCRGVGGLPTGRSGRLSGGGRALARPDRPGAGRASPPCSRSRASPGSGRARCSARRRPAARARAADASAR